MKIYKEDFATKIADTLKYDISVTEQVIKHLFEEMEIAIRDGKTIIITNFGRIEKVIHKGHPSKFAKNKSINDYYVVKLKVAKRLRDSINNRT